METDVSIIDLQHKLKFPATAYVKENGFLGLISYNKDTDSLLFATKSVVDYAAKDDDLVNVFKNLYMELSTGVQRQNLLEYLRKRCATIVCECIHQQADSHIIEYPTNRIYLLDIINNDFKNNKKPYDYLLTVATDFGLICKEKAKTFNDWEELFSWYSKVQKEDYKYKGRYIEGFVIEDSNGYMVKIKLPYYRTWKMLRNFSYYIIKDGYIHKTGALQTPEQNYFYKWLKDNRENYIKTEEDGKKRYEKINIIDLRNRFYKDYEKH